MIRDVIGLTFLNVITLTDQAHPPMEEQGVEVRPTEDPLEEIERNLTRKGDASTRR